MTCTSNDVIFSLNGRDNCFLDILKKDLNYEEVNKSLSSIFLKLKEILKGKGIEYSSLKHALTPSREKIEILLIFDRQKIDNPGYGQVIMDYLFQNLDSNGTHTFMCGDYIDIIDNQDLLKSMLLAELGIADYEKYYKSNQFYFIYINNVSESLFNKLKAKLGSFSPFVGVINVFHGSLLKDYLSFILCNSFIKIDKCILKQHPDDVDNDVNELSGLEKFGYTTKSIQDVYYLLFLSYKIECTQNNSDNHFSICALTPNITDPKKMFIKISDGKFNYLKNEKTGIMKRLNFLNISVNELEEKIKNRIENNYFFNLRICSKDNSYIFNIILEFNTNKKYKVLASFKYDYFKNELFLITLY